MRVPTFFLALSLALGAGVSARADIVIGLATPLSGPNAIIGEQMRLGAAAALAGTDVELVIVEDGCSAESGAIAGRMLAERGVAVAIGFTCTETIGAAMPALARAGIPAITPVIRTASLTDRREQTGWPVFRLGPRSGDEQEAVAETLVTLWRDEHFAVVDDGTIYGRELVESFRLAAELSGLRAVFVDTYRPQLENQIGLVGRLRRSGATHVLVGGDFDDIAIIARDAAEMDYPLVIAGGEALRSAPGEVPLSRGVLMIAAPEWRELAAPATLDALAEAGIEIDGYALPTHAAVEIATLAIEAALDSGRDIETVLLERPFPTVVGTVDFDERGDQTGFEFRLYRHDGERFLPWNTETR